MYCQIINKLLTVVYYRLLTGKRKHTGWTGHPGMNAPDNNNNSKKLQLIVPNCDV